MSYHNNSERSDKKQSNNKPQNRGKKPNEKDRDYFQKDSGYSQEAQYGSHSAWNNAIQFGTNLEPTNFDQGVSHVKGPSSYGKPGSFNLKSAKDVYKNNYNYQTETYDYHVDPQPRFIQPNKLKNFNEEQYSEPRYGKDQFAYQNQQLTNGEGRKKWEGQKAEEGEGAHHWADNFQRMEAANGQRFYHLNEDHSLYGKNTISSFHEGATTIGEIGYQESDPRISSIKDLGKSVLKEGGFPSSGDFTTGNSTQAKKKKTQRNKKASNQVDNERKNRGSDQYKVKETGYSQQAKKPRTKENSDNWRENQPFRQEFTYDVTGGGSKQQKGYSSKYRESGKDLQGDYSGQQKKGAGGKSSNNGKNGTSVGIYNHVVMKHVRYILLF